LNTALTLIAMRTIVFEVPAEVMPDFTEKLTDLDLDNTLSGSNSEGEIRIVVKYEREETESVDELEEYLRELVREPEDEEDEDHES